MTTSVLILGLGASGVAAARYCAARPERFKRVVAIDGSNNARVEESGESLKALGVEVLVGGPSEPAGDFDLCVASPGIPPHAPIMQFARTVSAEIISEIEFAYRESRNPWIAITGTNGKTTTTALVEHLLTVGGISARAVGNIGTPAIEAVGHDDPDQILVAEVSSFQLALSSRFHPRVAVLLNVTPDHIDWHGSLERYAEDKAKVFANLNSNDTAVIDIDDPGSRARVDQVTAVGARVVRVSVSSQAQACLGDGVLTLENDGGPLSLLHVDDLLIRGPHNVSNALAAAAAAHAMGVHASDLRRGLSTFRPIEHRLEPVGNACGAEWFNDSKATNPDAVSKAITAFSDRSFVLLLGGRNKGNDFRPLAEQASGAARTIVAFGEARGEIVAAFAGTGAHVIEEARLAAAVQRAASVAMPGDAVLLSPACASFDEFSNYEERGRRFKALVADLGSCEQ